MPIHAHSMKRHYIQDKISSIKELIETQTSVYQTSDETRVERNEAFDTVENAFLYTKHIDQTSVASTTRASVNK